MHTMNTTPDSDNTKCAASTAQSHKDIAIRVLLAQASSEIGHAHSLRHDHESVNLQVRIVLGTLQAAMRLMNAR